MKKLKNILILFNLWRLETSATFNNLTSLIVNGIVQSMGLEWDWNCKQIGLFWNRWGYYFLMCEIQCHHLVDVETCSICLWCALYSAPHKLGYFNLEWFEFGNQDQILVFFYTIIKWYAKLTKLIQLLECKVNKILKNIVDLNVIIVQFL